MHVPQQLTSPSAPAPLVDESVDESLDAALDVGFGNLWRVIIHNDEVTPYDYVISVLETVFFLSSELAEHVTWTAHEQGQAVVVIRPRTEAERLVDIAKTRARLDGFPLTFTLEIED